MNAIVSQVIIVLVSVIFGGLFSYFITSLTQRKIFKSIAEELTQYHEKIYHRVPIEDLLKEQQAEYSNSLKEHEERCIAPKDIEKLKMGVVWLVSQAGGNPHDLDLH